ncbi:hypothetical protein BDF14DRAFT_1849194 [Spinellus fusiger]|nr:hypothetical protein BDF14DRAFT_1849194 [Spinellus fusiger]
MPSIKRQPSLKKKQSNLKKKNTKKMCGIDVPKPFPCTEYEGCNKSFSRTEHLARHIRKHTKEKPYPCINEGCNKCFSRFDNMMQHQRTHLSSIEKAILRKTRAERTKKSGSSVKTTVKNEISSLSVLSVSSSWSSSSNQDIDEVLPQTPIIQEKMAWLPDSITLPPIVKEKLAKKSTREKIACLHPNLSFSDSTVPMSLTSPTWSSHPFSDSDLDQGHLKCFSWQYTPKRRSTWPGASSLREVPLGRRLSVSDLERPMHGLRTSPLGALCLSDESDENYSDGAIVISSNEYEALEGMERLLCVAPL